MSTNLKPTTNHLLTNFYGGIERGRCLQVTTKNWLPPSVANPGFIQLTKKDALELITALAEWLNDERPESFD